MTSSILGLCCVGGGEIEFVTAAEGGRQGVGQIECPVSVKPTTRQEGYRLQQSREPGEM